MYNILASTLVTILFVVGLIILFIVVTIINLNTKKPEDCTNETETCSTCTITCIHNKNEIKKEDNDKD